MEGRRPRQPQPCRREAVTGSIGR